jgi:DNA-binding CsgD family transcriptional regulator/tetratricopeptide (TPR) repeat protein
LYPLFADRHPLPNRVKPAERSSTVLVAEGSGVGVGLGEGLGLGEEKAPEIDHVELLQRLAQASYYSKHDRRAITAYREAMAEIPVDDVARRADIQGRLARSLWASGEWAAATEAYEEALRIAPDEPTDTRTRAMAGLAQTYMANGQYARSKPLCDEAVKRARATGNRQLEGHVLNTLGMDLAWLGEPAAGQAVLDAALEIALELEHPDDVGRAYVNRLETLVLSGRMDEALASATEGIEAVERMGTVLSYGPYIHVAATYAAFQAGRWNLAVEHLEQADRLVPPEEMGPYRACQVVHFLACRGDPSAPDVWEYARRHMGEMPPSNLMVQLHIGGIELAAHAERFAIAIAIAIADEGLALLARTDAWIRASELARVAAWPIADLGIRARMNADEDGMGRAHERINELAGLAAASLRHLEAQAGPLEARLELDRAQVDAERDRLRGDSDVDTWSSIADGWLDAERPYRALYPRWRAAEAAYADGDRGSAVAILRRCHVETRALGAVPMTSKLERLGRRMRVRLDTGDPAVGRLSERSPYGLTPREDEVLAWLVAGRTNQQIADELFITRSTAGVHVSNILSKLGVSSRAEASDLARRESLTQESPTDRQQDGR